MKINPKILHLIAFTLILSGCQKVPSLSPYDYAISELNYGDEPENIVFYPRAINDEETIVGIGYHAQLGFPLIYRQNAMVEMTGMSNDVVLAYDINNTGAFVGNTWATGHAFLHSDEGIININDFVDTSQFSSSVAWGINNHNEFVGGLYTSTSPSTAVPFVFENQSVSTIDVCSSEMTSGVALEINDNGSIVGFCISNNFQQDFTFVRYQGETRVLAFEGLNNVVGMDINDHDVMVGSYTTSDNEVHGFTFNLQNEEFKDLGAFGGYVMMDINNQGVVIITGEKDNSIYHPQSGLKKLEDIVDLSAWSSIQDINGLNEKGQIVGNGFTADGQKRGFILNPLKP